MAADPDPDPETLSHSYLYPSVLTLQCIRDITTGSNQNQIGRYIASFYIFLLPEWSINFSTI